MTKLAHVTGKGVIDAFPVLDPALAKAGFALADCFHADYLKACFLAPDDASVGWVTTDGGEAFAAPAASAVVLVRIAFGDDLLRALTSGQVTALAGAKPLDQRLLSAQRRPFPETSPKIARLAAVVGTTPAAWFDAVTAPQTAP